MAIPYGPQWYAAVMGTGIVAVALPGLPFAFPGVRAVSLGFWLLAVVLLTAVTVTMVVTLRAEPGLLRRQYDDPAMAHFYGAPAMALLTIGAGAMGVGRDVLGGGAAVVLDAVLWSLGTVLGLIAAVAVSYRAITCHQVADDAANGGWLMPVVPPMVSATTGALLVSHVSGQEAQTLLLGCYACFGVTLFLGILVLGQIWQRLVRYGVPAPAAVPAVWIVLGFLGQSVTAAQHLGALAPRVLPVYGTALRDVAVVYGVPVWGFAVVWTALALALTVRQLCAGLPFAPTWWSFTFPVGTVVTGTSALAAATGLGLFRVLAVIYAAGLLIGWGSAAAGTVRALVSRPGR